MKKIILALVLSLACLVIATPSHADGKVAVTGLNDADIGTLGTTPFTLKRCVHTPGSAASLVFVRRYATVATGTVLAIMGGPSNGAPIVYDFEAMFTGFTQTAGSVKNSSALKGINAPDGGLYLDAVTQTAGHTTCSYR